MFYSVPLTITSDPQIFEPSVRQLAVHRKICRREAANLFKSGEVFYIESGIFKKTLQYEG
jgi:hypothetical protein